MTDVLACRCVSVMCVPLCLWSSYVCLHVCVSWQHISIRAALQHLVHARVIRLFTASLRALVNQRHEKHHDAPDHRRNAGQIKCHVIGPKMIAEDA